VVGVDGELEVHDFALELEWLVLVAVHDEKIRDRTSDRVDDRDLLCGPFEDAEGFSSGIK
jgi:hypothetical protein